MRLNTYFSLLLSISLLTTGCINSRTNPNDSKKMDKNLSEGKLVGTYSGGLPCIDCQGIDTRLILNPENTYKLEYVYAGKSDEVFLKSGKWSYKEGELLLEGLDYKYKVENTLLRQLDLSGKQIVGDLSERYVLKREE